jgi:biopolymer transport protein TolR
VMSMAFDLKPSSRPLSDINVTPLVDVMLVLLVIFMVTAPMLTQGMPVDLPQAPSRALESVQPLVVSITRDQAVYLNETRLDLPGLSRELVGRVGAQKGLEVLLKSDREVPYGLVVQVMGLIKEAGVEKLGIVTSPAP